jgi:dTDP-4-amino-4,6-dideoxygalactose transaminase
MIIQKNMKPDNPGKSMRRKTGNIRAINYMKPFVPPYDDFQFYLDRIWDSRILTNDGPLHAEFEKALCQFLKVDHLCLISSGTLALAIALRSLGLKGEVITTPFTSVATIQAIYWNNLIPVFADIHEHDLNLDLSCIEQAITPETSAIMPVHVFGNPCKVEQVKNLALKYNLKVVYDAAHCFGVKINGEAASSFGDLSALSFHATKVFNTIEGGAIVCHDLKTRDFINALKNTGLSSCNTLAGYGLNVKMNELQAAFGLAQLKHIDGLIEKRRKASLLYRELLAPLKGLRLITEEEGVSYNYSYFPVIITPAEFGSTRDEIALYLENHRISTKKYFHPLVSEYVQFSRYKTKELPVATNIAENVLCLPLYHDITREEIQRVVDLIRVSAKYQASTKHQAPNTK